MTTLETVLAGARRGLIRFGSDESGATAIEYAMIAGGISVVIASTVHGIGSQLKTNFYGKIAAAFP